MPLLSLLLATSQPLYHEEKDPMTDKSVITLAYENDGNTMGFLCNKTDPGQGVTIVLYSKRWIGRLANFVRGNQVMYRFDDDPAVTSYAWLFSNHSVALREPRYEIASFAHGLIAARRVFFRIENSDGENIDIPFEISDSTKEFDLFRKQCADTKFEAAYKKIP